MLNIFPMGDHRSGNSLRDSDPNAIDLGNFVKRLEVFYSHWMEKSVDLWGSADAIAIATPPPSEDFRYRKSSTLSMWLLGLELSETVMVFMHRQIHFLCSQREANLLQVLKNPTKDTVDASTVIHIRANSDSGSLLMDNIFWAIHTQAKSNGHACPIVGYLPKEDPEGFLLETWADKLKCSGYQLTNVSDGFSDLFAIKDNMELVNVKKAAFLTASVMKHFVVPKLGRIIEEEKKVSHAALRDGTEKAILEPARIKVKLEAKNVNICYLPIFQSGGEFDLRPTASSTEENLYYDSRSVIICAIGSRYTSYCSNVARTFLIDANVIQSKAYEVLLKAHAAAIAALEPGNRVGAAYLAALSVVKRDGPEFAANLTKSAGSGIGLQFRESSFILNAKNEQMVKAGMVFNVSLGFQNLQAHTNNPKTDKFSLLLADTILVNENYPEVLTLISSKAVMDVAYPFKALLSKATLRSGNQEISKELRRQHQAELARQKSDETYRRLTGGGSGTRSGRGAVESSRDLIAYKNVNDVIPPTGDLMIQIDHKNEAVLVPINGTMTPFHIAMVKNVNSQENNGTCYIRISFNVPRSACDPHSTNSLEFKGCIYLKDLSFRSKDPRHTREVVQQIKTLRRQFTSRESERAERMSNLMQRS